MIIIIARCFLQILVAGSVKGFVNMAFRWIPKAVLSVNVMLSHPVQ